MTSEHAGEKLLQAFDEKFQNMKSQQKDLNIFSALFKVEPADVSDNL